METSYRDDRQIVERLGRCRQLRREQTDAERRLWQSLRGRQLSGVKFRRQHEFGPYVLDFYCPERNLAVEADGGQHLEAAAAAADPARTRYLEARGVRVLRFTDTQVLMETEAVLEVIRQVVEEPSPQPSPKGRGS